MTDKSEFVIIGTNTLDQTKLLFSSIRGLNRGIINYRHATLDTDEYMSIWTSNNEKIRILGTGGMNMKTTADSNGILFRLGYNSFDSSNLKRYDISMSSNGDLIYKAGTNTTNTVQFQDASGVNYINIDGVNKRLGVNKANPIRTLHVGGDLSVDGSINWGGTVNIASKTNQRFFVFNEMSGPSIVARQAGTEPVVHFLNSEVNTVKTPGGTIGNSGTEGKTLTLTNTADYEDITDETELIISGESKRIYVQSKDGSNVITVNNDIIVNNGTSFTYRNPRSAFYIKSGGFTGFSAERPSHIDEAIVIGNELYQSNKVAIKMRNSATKYMKIEHDASSNESINFMSGESHVDFRFSNNIAGNVDSNKVVIRTDGKMGIGITNPSINLEVKGKSYISEKLGIGTSSPDHNLDVIGNTYVSGNLGLGKTTPDNKLDVVGNTYVSGKLGIGITNPTNKLSVIGNSYMSGNVGIGLSNPNNKLEVDGNLYISGNLGIGVPNPQSKIHIDGTVQSNVFREKFIVTVNAGKYLIDGVQNPNITLQRGKEYLFDLSDSSTNSHPFYITTHINGGSGSSGQYTTGVTGNGNHYGTTTKTVIFSVPHNAPGSLYYHCGNHSGMGNKINIDGTILSSSTNKAKITLENTTDEDVIRFNTNNTERMKIENGKITVNSNVELTSVGDISLKLKADSGDSNENSNALLELSQDNEKVILQMGGVGDAGEIYTDSLQDSQYLLFKTTDSTVTPSMQFATQSSSSAGLKAVMTILGDGKIGLDKKDPGYRLSFSNINETKLCFNDAGSGNIAGIGVSNISSNSHLNYHVDSVNSKHVFYSTGSNGNGNELMKIEGDGKVGIGITTSLSNLLELRSTSMNTPGLLLGESDTNRGKLLWNKNTSKLCIDTENNQPVQVGSEWMNITGIGTSFYNKSNIDNTGKHSIKELYLDQRTTPTSGATNWRIFVTDDQSEARLNFYNNGNMGGYIMYNLGGYGSLSFTGQHRPFYPEYSLSTLESLNGLIVCANKNNYTSLNGRLCRGKRAIKIAESLPDISISNKDEDKSVFGVISTVEDPDNRVEEHGLFGSKIKKERGDTRPYINSLGEGAIWVTDKNGNLESGDYITTCTIPGYGIRQNSGALMNYTVAKITMDCDFNPSIQPVEIILKDINGENILDSNGFLQWVNSENETELKYDIRYLLEDGTQINKEDYEIRKNNGESVYRAAFVGCTYHCG